MTIIRPVENADWIHLGAVAEEAYINMPLAGPFSREAWERNWKNFAQSPVALIQVVVVEGTPRGLLVGVLSTDPATDQTVAAMIMWNISPAHRGSGIKLLKTWMKLAKERGAVRLTMNHLLDTESKKLEPFYLKMGMTPLEKHYTMEL